MAEAVFRHKVSAARLDDNIEADSAGTGDWHTGESPHSGTRRVLAVNDVEYQHRARQITPQDLQHFDYVVTMDNANLRTVQAMTQGKARVVPFLDYAPASDVREVPDPYYTGDFEETYALANQAADGLLAAIRREHGL